MRECRIVHINDGRPQETTNGNFYFSETYPRTEKELQTYLDQGYEVKHMVPMVSPAIQKEGAYSFYLSGFTFYLEREVPEGEEGAAEPPESGEELDEACLVRPEDCKLAEELEDWDFNEEEDEE